LDNNAIAQKIKEGPGFQNVFLMVSFPHKFKFTLPLRYGAQPIVPSLPADKKMPDAAGNRKLPAVPDNE
jgi:hypothetical protein